MIRIIRNLWLIIIGIILASSIASQSQVSDDMMIIIKYNPPDSLSDSTNNKKSHIKIPTNPKELANLSIKFYQYFISSQDVPSCVFTPSCSRFAELSINRFGILKGALLTSDRLQRCHLFEDKYYWYTFNLYTNRFNDPVSRYGEDK
jgi:putative component of membrane protein insertase Oxa1/YidC/SpoIIIJ protein YidD